MFIRNGLRFDALKEHTIDGEKFPASAFQDPETRARLGITIGAEPLPPADYSEDTYTFEKIDPAPYVVYTKRSDAEIAAIAARKLAQAETAAAKAENKENATVKYLTTHTAAQIENYVDTNITNLATAKTVIARLAVAVGVLLRD